MTKVSRKTSRGFTFVELLAVVLVLAVLAAVAIPIYMNSRRQAAARTCLANLGTIARSSAAYAIRNGRYPEIGELVGAPEGIEQLGQGNATCPLTRGATDYSITTPAGVALVAGTGSTAAIQVRCVNADTHDNAITGTTLDVWRKDLPALPTAEGTL
jgi:prepilin-type N-terminal cleavage/methylation domain-containing protein